VRPDKIVQALRVDPDVLKKLIAYWQEWSGGIFVAASDLVRMQKIFKGRPSLSQMVTALEQWASKVLEYDRFTSPCGHCYKEVQLTEARWDRINEHGQMAPWLCDECEQLYDLA